MIVLTSANLVMKRDWASINRFNPVTYMCLSQDRIYTYLSALIVVSFVLRLSGASYELTMFIFILVKMASVTLL